LIHHFHLFDVPDHRKEHKLPIPTMGGIASCFGMMVGCFFWFPFQKDPFIVAFFLSVAVLFAVGLMDDLRNLSARYKLVIQVAVALLIAFSDVRITSFHGMLGIHELPEMAQYTFTVLAIAGITNAFNLIDGVDGLAGGLGFMSLMLLGLFLTLSGDTAMGIIAFALGGGLLGFLYYNFNPARIFMGDTGSLVLGFVIAVLCVRIIQLNPDNGSTFLPHAPVFAFSIVAVPVFDTIRVFAIRLWQGRSPFSPDKNHIHHLLTANGWSHQFTAKAICIVHAIILLAGYMVKVLPQIAGLSILFTMMLITIYIFQRLEAPKPTTDVVQKLPAEELV
jgi:UDP-N-acetylmuramyl pentapeptide phosphotransferase/UDP-N-acetylglucosamine-1-phosphate transferase